MFSGSKAPMPAHGLFCWVLYVCVTLACVCASMLTGRGPNVILYASIWLCVYDLYVGMVRYASLARARYIQWVGTVYGTVCYYLCDLCVHLYVYMIICLYV